MKQIQRMCCVCKKHQNKFDMTRITYNQSNLCIDDKKQTCGKATYVCNDLNCRKTLISKKILNRVFKENISDNEYQKLTQELEIAK